MSEPKSFHLSPEIHRYILDHSSPLDEVAQSLMERTQALGDIAIMSIAPEQGLFMHNVATAMGATRVIEVGTFTGMSALWLARALPPDGTLLCCDISEEWTAIGREHWERAGVADRIDLRIGPAAETLEALDPDPTWDLAFIDADKTNYGTYWDLIVPRLRAGGMVLVDNVLWSGAVVDESATDPDTQAIRAFNRKAADDPRTHGVILPVSDGLGMFIRR